MHFLDGGNKISRYIDEDEEVAKKETKEVGKYKNENMELAIHEVGEDNTKYGEFVSTYFAWIPLSKQKERAREMEKMTKKEKQKNKI